jgi:hypothetical protein
MGPERTGMAAERQLCPGVEPLFSRPVSLLLLPDHGAIDLQFLQPGG